MSLTRISNGELRDGQGGACPRGDLCLLKALFHPVRRTIVKMAEDSVSPTEVVRAWNEAYADRRLALGHACGHCERLRKLKLFELSVGSEVPWQRRYILAPEAGCKLCRCLVELDADDFSSGRFS